MTTPEVNDVTKTIVETGPFVAKNIVPTLWMVGVAVLGGLVSFYQKVRSGRTRPMNITELLGEIVTSAFAGLITYWICKFYGVNEYLMAAGVAISGHMGARAIFIAENWIEKKAEQQLPK